MRLASLQADELLESKIYTNDRTVELDRDECIALHLIRFIYIQYNFGDVLYNMLVTHNKYDQKLVLQKIDPVFYKFFHSNNVFIGINGSEVGDLLRAGNSELKKSCEIRRQKLVPESSENHRSRSLV